MQKRVKIAFQAMDGTPDIRDAIEQHCVKLEQRHGAMRTCWVAVRGPDAQGGPGVYEVKIRLAPADGPDVNVGPPPARHPRYADLTFAIDDSFRRARRRLQDHARQMQKQPKRAPAEPVGRKAIRGASDGGVGTPSSGMPSSQARLPAGVSEDVAVPSVAKRRVSERGKSVKRAQARGRPEAVEAAERAPVAPAAAGTPATPADAAATAAEGLIRPADCGSQTAPNEPSRAQPPAVIETSPVCEPSRAQPPAVIETSPVCEPSRAQPPAEEKTPPGALEPGVVPPAVAEPQSRSEPSSGRKAERLAGAAEVASTLGCSAASASTFVRPAAAAPASASTANYPASAPPNSGNTDASGPVPAPLSQIAPLSVAMAVSFMRAAAAVNAVSTGWVNNYLVHSAGLFGSMMAAMSSSASAKEANGAADHAE